MHKLFCAIRYYLAQQCILLLWDAYSPYVDNLQSVGLGLNPINKTLVNKRLAVYPKANAERMFAFYFTTLMNLSVWNLLSIYG